MSDVWKCHFGCVVAGGRGGTPVPAFPATTQLNQNTQLIQNFWGNAVPPNILLEERRSPTYYQDMGNADTVAFPQNESLENSEQLCATIIIYSRPNDTR